MKKPRWTKVAAGALALIAVIFISIMIYWSRMPDAFWVNHTVHNLAQELGWMQTGEFAYNGFALSKG